MGDESDFLERERYTEEEGWRETKQEQGQQEDGERVCQESIQTQEPVRKMKDSTQTQGLHGAP